MSKYHEALNTLVDLQVDFLITGTWALKEVYPDKLKNYKVTDCDIIVPNEMSTIRKAIGLLKSIGWKTSVWEVVIDENVAADFLTGKYYIRCKHQEFVLDITYENDYYTWEELNEGKTDLANYQMVALNKILRLKKIKNRSQDHEIIALFDRP
ncbi:MAG: hypothetical protein AAFQ94_07905 [Bacteroidota bacterium]